MSLLYISFETTCSCALPLALHYLYSGTVIFLVFVRGLEECAPDNPRRRHENEAGDTVDDAKNIHRGRQMRRSDAPEAAAAASRPLAQSVAFLGHIAQYFQFAKTFWHIVYAKSQDGVVATALYERGQGCRSCGLMNARTDGIERAGVIFRSDRVRISTDRCTSKREERGCPVGICQRVHIWFSYRAALCMYQCVHLCTIGNTCTQIVYS